MAASRCAALTPHRARQGFLMRAQSIDRPLGLQQAHKLFFVALFLSFHLHTFICSCLLLFTLIKWDFIPRNYLSGAIP